MGINFISKVFGKKTPNGLLCSTGFVPVPKLPASP
jgi:hypothetical protein